MDSYAPTCGHEAMVIGLTCVACLRADLARERAARLAAEDRASQLERDAAYGLDARRHDAEQALKWKAERDAAVAALKDVIRACGCDRLKPAPPTPCEPCDVARAALAKIDGRGR